MSGGRIATVFAICTSLLLGNLALPQGLSYTPVPSGFDFPADERVLLDAVSRGDEEQLRTHAWTVFAGLTQKTRQNDPNSEAVWETWYTGDEVFSAETGVQKGLRSLKRDLVAPRQFSPHGGAHLKAAGESQLSSTLFNQELKDHTRSEKLQLHRTMKAINDGWPTQTPVENRKVKDYPRGAMSLKLVWMPVAKNGMTAIPTWDEMPVTDVAGAFPPSSWKRRVAVDPSRSSVPEGELTDLPGFPGSRVVPLTAFHHFKLDAEQAARFGRDEGDYAVLVGMHYTTKEIPNWFWATFWWHDRPNDGPYAADRLDDTKIRGPWRNYLMDIAYDMDLPKETNGTPNAVFNPWLEAHFENGVNSNCMTCHQRAIWTEPDATFLPITRGAAPANDPIFRNSTKVDFLWSLPLEGNN
ncbi:hypothetical protein [Sinorhizobium medicae]|uniref:hypothetical protein n=1 Tax=Sinorhizobium medicae TaxID=110321 RepID=UPI000C798893|nr:hypothetical protein [Sinorhizobium medicae]MDX0426973.1 hypothetical protein [Sinorhizobium medicae]MDX0642329.1 hypothetical protein [Sinorhizobium medicae]PLT95429.1 hypothetical protein BMJ32_30375 [Sinorhizobium medicae]PLU54249.1 hypothetical protein BMJ23_21740 [Sinorhizobium medicae]PLU60257.1 hypothetical protein BMJ22_32335 [Sinorhizobium medicae]